jgi:uncharacterized protein (DUF1800 family)
MNGKRNAFLCGLLTFALLLSPPLARPLAAGDDSAQAKSAGKQLSQTSKGRLPIGELGEEEAIFHALNRLAYGPRPGEIERVRKMGLEKWIEAQLKPESIDNSSLTARLEKYPTIALRTTDLLEKYPNPQMEARRLGMTPEQYREKQEEERRKKLQEAREKLRNDPAAREQLMQPGARQRLGQDPQARQALLMELVDDNSPRRIIGELSAVKLTRAVYSERQLEEVLADFWFNHFNVFAQKGPTLWMLPEYEREAIRPHVLGKFRAMLEATAKSPAMLFYLDNWQSADPEAAKKLENELNQRRQRFLALFPGANPAMLQQRGRLGQQNRPGAPNQPPQNRLPRGLNENYARELMELHTLGVDGGYTQQDVIEVARAFTGWTLGAPRQNPEFRFESRIHSSEPKAVLGRKIDSGGMRDGEAVLDLLARHPSTAKFISTKLARKFVSDAPPAALIERMAKRFSETDGDIREVMRAMIYSPEFWSRAAYRAKIKKPFELVASAARAVGADVQVPFQLVQWVARIGEPLYLCQPPTGYADKAETWVNTGALLNRMNFSVELASGRLRGARVSTAQLFGEESMSDPQATLSRAMELFLAGQASPQTRATLEKQMSDPQILRATLDDRVRSVDAGIIAGLVLGSPEFQRR